MILFRKITQELKTYFSSKFQKNLPCISGSSLVLCRLEIKADIILSVLAFSNSKT